MNTNRQNNFNLIRLILALLVILGHSPELVDGNRNRELLTKIFGTLSLGELAVDAFFLLSGYLIMQSWDSQPHAWKFLKKRLLRIYPGFIVASLFCAFLVGPLASNYSKYFDSFHWIDFWKGILFLTTPAIPPVFEGTNYPNVNGAMWTISREFSCYLFVLLAGVSGAFRVRHFLLIVTAIVFGVLVWLRLKNMSVGDLRLASFFLSGACFYRYRHRVLFNGYVAGILLIITIAFLFSWRASELVLASMGGYVLFYAAGKKVALLNQFNRFPDVSYGVYLYGWPIQKLLLWNYPSISPWTLFAVAAPVAILAGLVSWYVIEKPALRFKKTNLQLARNEQEKLST